MPDIPWLASVAQERHWLAAVSGGADSVALLHLLQRNGWRQVTVCHFDHQLRGPDTGREDAAFVCRLAAELGYACLTGQDDVLSLAGSSGQSVETAARNARHRFFARCARETGCPDILLAHHAGDQAETILWNLLRGSAGLSGMRPVQQLQADGTRLVLHRPLLQVSRKQLRSWLEEEGLPWREDPTNAQPVATRNRLRNEALPLLEEIAHRDVTASLLRAFSGSEELAEIRKWAVQQAAAEDPQGRLHVPGLKKLPPALQAACFHDYLHRAGVPDLSRAVIDRCLSLLDTGAPHVVTLPGGLQLRRRQGRCFLVSPTISPS